MGRRILNRKELRANDEAPEKPDPGEEEEVTGPEEEAEAESAAPSKPARRKSRAKPAREVRLKAFWGVFGQAGQQVAQFEYSQRAEAEKKAKELSESKKAPHFVQLVKKVIEE